MASDWKVSLPRRRFGLSRKSLPTVTIGVRARQQRHLQVSIPSAKPRHSKPADRLPELSLAKQSPRGERQTRELWGRTYASNELKRKAPLCLPLCPHALVLGPQTATTRPIAQSSCCHRQLWAGRSLLWRPAEWWSHYCCCRRRRCPHCSAPPAQHCAELDFPRPNRWRSLAGRKRKPSPAGRRCWPRLERSLFVVMHHRLQPAERWRQELISIQTSSTSKLNPTCSLSFSARRTQCKRVLVKEKISVSCPLLTWASPSMPSWRLGANFQQNPPAKTRGSSARGILRRSKPSDGPLWWRRAKLQVLPLPPTRLAPPPPL